MKENSEKSWNWREFLKLIIVSLLIIVPFRMYVAQPFIVDGASMYPTFDNGHYLVVDEISYRFEEPQRGEVIVFEYPKDRSKNLIKRVIGLPGEIVSIKDGEVSITSSAYPTGFVLEEPYVEFSKADNLSYTLGQGEYFVMGDNRLQSADSRLWGPIKRGDIIGRAIFRLYPTNLWPGFNSYKGS